MDAAILQVTIDYFLFASLFPRPLLVKQKDKDICKQAFLVVFMGELNQSKRKFRESSVFRNAERGVYISSNRGMRSVTCVRVVRSSRQTCIFGCHHSGYGYQSGWSAQQGNRIQFSVLFIYYRRQYRKLFCVWLEVRQTNLWIIISQYGRRLFATSPDIKVRYLWGLNDAFLRFLLFS